jgi:hypothetical protein
LLDHAGLAIVMRRSRWPWDAEHGEKRAVKKCRLQTAQRNKTGLLSMIEGISAATLGIHEMPRAARFYRALGFEVLHGGEESSFSSFIRPTFKIAMEAFSSWRQHCSACFHF